MNEYGESNLKTTLNKKEEKKVKKKSKKSIYIKLFGEDGRYVVIDS